MRRVGKVDPVQDDVREGMGVEGTAGIGEDGREQVPHPLQSDAMLDRRAHLLLAKGPFEDGDATSSDAESLGDRAVGVVGLVKDETEKDEVEGVILEGKLLGGRDPDVGARDVFRGRLDHGGVGVDAGGFQSAAGKALGEEPGADSHVEGAREAVAGKADIDDALDFEALDALRGSEAVGVASKTFFMHCFLHRLSSQSILKPFSYSIAHVWGCRPRWGALLIARRRAYTPLHMVEFIHTSDWHLGNPFSAFSDEQQRSLASARLEGVRALLDHARAEGVTLVLVAGDQIDNGELRDARVLLELFGLIGSYPDIEVVMIAGNHDPLTPTSVYRRVDASSYPGNLRFVQRPEVVDLPERGVRILAAPLDSRNGRTNPIVELVSREGGRGASNREAAGTGGAARGGATGTGGATRREDATARGAQAPVVVGLAHGSLELGEMMEGGDSFPVSPGLADESRLDYLALGDWHSYLRSGERTYYPGTHEPLAFGDDGGALRVRIAGPGARPEVRRIGSPIYRWLELERTLDDSGLPALLETLSEAAGGPARDHTLVRLLLDGYVSLERFKLLEERIAIADSQLFALFRGRTPSIRPSEEELRSLAGEGYMRRVVERLLELARGGDATADAALLRVHEFFRAAGGE